MFDDDFRANFLVPLATNPEKPLGVPNKPQEELVKSIITSTIACISSMGFEINKRQVTGTPAACAKEEEKLEQNKSLTGRVPAELHYLMDHLAQNVHAAWASKHVFNSFFKTLRNFVSPFAFVQSH